MPREFQGTITALITPMYEDGRVHQKDLRKLVEYQLANGIDGIVVAGTTGESPTLHDEQRIINSRVIDIVDGKVPVIIGTGTYDTNLSEKLTEEAEHDGASATLHVMGYYNRPSQLGVIDYFDKVAQVAPELPVIMYNIPPRGAAEYKPETMVYLAKNHPNIIGVKEASGGEVAIATARKTRELADRHELPNFLITSGDDDLTYTLMSDPTIRGDGVISVMANLLPRSYMWLTRRLLAGSTKEGQELNEILAPLNGMVGVRDSYTISIDGVKYEIANDSFRNPAPVKAAAYILGMIESPAVRSPLVTMTKSAMENVGRRLAKVYQVNPNLFIPIREYFKVDVGRKLEPYRVA